MESDVEMQHWEFGNLGYFGIWEFGILGFGEFGDLGNW